MKNILKSGLLAIAALLLAASCSEDKEVGPANFWVSVSGPSDEAVGRPGGSVSVELTLRSSQGISTLVANSEADPNASISVTEGALEETVTYTYNVPSNATLFQEQDITFTLTDQGGNTDAFTFTVNTNEDPATFSQLGIITLTGGEGAAEISAYDTTTMQLFVVNNGTGNNRIDVINISNPSTPALSTSIDLSTFGGGANSVAVDQGRLAVAVEANNPQDNGQVLIYNTSSLTTAPIQRTVGPLPDMVTFSPNGNWIIVANEGEPNDAYTVDPEGSVSILDASGEAPSYTVTTATFTAFNDQVAALAEGGFRVFGPGATLAEDVEPEYVTVSSDSETAFVTLQENNGVAVVDIATATVSAIVPLGFKNYATTGNDIDPSDADGIIALRSPVNFSLFGVYQPDAIATFTIGDTDYLITANEGDSRDYPGFSNESTVGALTLDGIAFPDAATTQLPNNYGNLKVMLDLGNSGGDADYDEIYSYGARSFTIWDTDGNAVFDSGNDLDAQAIGEGIYPDGRSDDKSVEPEGVVTGVLGDLTVAFIGLERADAVAVYDVSSPSAPSFLDIITTGDAPEGLVFIPQDLSPNERSLLVVSCEDDGTVRIYQTN